MKKYFDNMGLKKFRENSTFLFLLADAWILGFIYNKFTDKEFMDTLIGIAARQQGQSIDKTHIAQLYQLLTQSLILMLVLVAVVHLITYVLYNKNKKAAFAYLIPYSWSGGFGCLFWGASVINLSIIPGLVFITVGLFFLFNALGIKHFPHVPTKKT